MENQGGPPQWGYRPYLDGLRAVAVYLVVLFHAGVDRMSGGFIGVDVFFVLSGYLVTQLLLRDIEGPTRKVGLGRFYSRRARRLLPAAAVNLVVTAVVYAAIAAPVEIDAARRAIAAAALYFANWHFIGVSADYFAADLDPSPVLHYWSLSVEEQFYVLWPLLLMGLFRLAGRFGSRQRDAVRTVVLGAGLLSAGWALVLSGSDPNRAYYGTDTRAYQLLAGAAVALTPGLVLWLRRSRLAVLLPAVTVGLLGGVLVLATSVIELDAIERGIAVTVATVGLLLAFEASDRGVLRGLLSWGPLVYLGRISYGTYLWHWIVVVVLGHEADLSPLATAAITVVVSTGIASLSYQVLEHPIRIAQRLDRHRLVVVGVGLVASLVVGLVVAPAVLDRSEGSAVAVGEGEAAIVGGPATMTASEAYFDTFDYEGCPPESSPCELVPGDGPTAIVIGDSHAAMYVPTLMDVARRHDVELIGGLMRYCPWPLGIAYKNVGPDCPGTQDDVFERMVPEVDPDIVFLAHRPIDDPGNASPVVDRDAGDLEDDPAERDAAVDRRVAELVERLRADGRTVVMFEPIPPAPLPLDPRQCLSEAEVAEECRFVTPEEPTNQEQAMRRLAAEDPDVISVDLDLLACPFKPICDPIVNGMIVRIDDNHMSGTFVRSLADPLDEYLVDQALFD